MPETDKRRQDDFMAIRTRDFFSSLVLQDERYRILADLPKKIDDYAPQMPDFGDWRNADGK